MSSRPILPALTSLRFFAAIYVVLFHGLRPYVHSDVGVSFVGTGFVGVDLFFVLSGFVLAYRYGDDDGKFVGSRRALWVARLARLYPVYIISVVIGAPLYISDLMSHNATGELVIKLIIAAVATLSLTQAWFYQTVYAFNTPCWSLSAEALLYVAFPSVMPRLIGAIKRHSIVSIGLLIWAVAMIIAVSYMVIDPDGLGHTDFHSRGPWLTTLRCLPLVHLPSFMLGIIAGWAHLRRKVLGSSPWLAVVAVAIAAAVIGGGWLPYPILHCGLLAPLFALLVYYIAGSDGPIVAAMGHPWLVVLGDTSYALCLLHLPLLAYAGMALGHTLSLAQFIVFLIAVQWLSIAVYRYIETPARRAIRRALAPRSR